MPDLDGSAVLTVVRATSDVPVVVTVRDDEREVVRLLDAGAATAAAVRRVVIGGLVIDPGVRMVGDVAATFGRPGPC